MIYCVKDSGGLLIIANKGSKMVERSLRWNKDINQQVSTLMCALQLSKSSGYQTAREAPISKHLCNNQLYDNDGKWENTKKNK